MSVISKVFKVAGKDENLLRTMLLFPYILWGAGLAFLVLEFWLVESWFTEDASAINTALEGLVGFVSFYTIGIILWGIPYTTLAIGLWLWSIKKPAPAIYKAFAFSPFLLAILMLGEIAVFIFLLQDNLYPINFEEFLSYILVAVVPALVIGYVFVGLGALLYRLTRNSSTAALKAETE